jgi:hypothetical protein
MNYRRQVFLLGVLFIAVTGASAAQCPSGAEPTSPRKVTPTPNPPKIGQKVTVTIEPPLTVAATVCWDQTVVATIKADTPLEFDLPKDFKQSDLTGSHTMSVVAGGFVYKTTVESPASNGDSAVGATGATGSCPPSSTGAAYKMAAAPQLPQIGQMVDVTIIPAIAGPFTAYLDKDVVKTTSDSATTFKFMVPGDPKGDPKKDQLTGKHTVRVVAGTVTYCTEVGTLEPKLTSVTSYMSGTSDDAFRVKLNGKGLDARDKTDIKIRFNHELLELCWSDSECKAKSLTVQASVHSDGETIELKGINPTAERTAVFSITVEGTSTAEQTDSKAECDYILVIVLSSTATLAIIGIVVGLVYKYLRPTMIEGDGYVVRALFMDKETNTYSLSKLQFYLWTIVAVFGYVYLGLARNWFQHVYGLPAVPSGLPGIVAIAGGTAVGAQIVTNINGPKGAGQLKPSLADFVTSGDVVAAERVQFLIWTIIGAVGFLMVVLNLDPRVLKDLPDVPSSILSISGLSAFGYLGGKLARDPGPVVSEVMVSMGPDPEATATGGLAAVAAPAVAPAAASSGTFGLMRLRGRMLSRDANFRVSTGEDSGSTEVDISFDQLQPSSKDDQHLKKPRVLEKDTDSTDPNMAKSLLLVVNMTDNLRNVLQPGSKHVVTVINPDSQKAIFKFQLPESQKPA